MVLKLGEFHLESQRISRQANHLCFSLFLARRMEEGYNCSRKAKHTWLILAKTIAGVRLSFQSSLIGSTEFFESAIAT